MPDSDKDRRTPEEIEEHYKQKTIRRAAQAEEHYKQKAERREVQVAERETRRHTQLADRRKVRDKRLLKEKARRLHKKGRYDWEKLSDKKKAALAALRPWDL